MRLGPLSLHVWLFVLIGCLAPPAGFALDSHDALRSRVHNSQIDPPPVLQLSAFEPPKPKKRPITAPPPPQMMAPPKSNKKAKDTHPAHAAAKPPVELTHRQRVRIAVDSAFKVGKFDSNPTVRIRNTMSQALFNAAHPSAPELLPGQKPNRTVTPPPKPKPKATKKPQFKGFKKRKKKVKHHAMPDRGSMDAAKPSPAYTLYKDLFAKPDPSFSRLPVPYIPNKGADGKPIGVKEFFRRYNQWKALTNDESIPSPSASDEARVHHKGIAAADKDKPAPQPFLKSWQKDFIIWDKYFKKLERSGQPRRKKSVKKGGKGKASKKKASPKPPSSLPPDATEPIKQQQSPGGPMMRRRHLKTKYRKVCYGEKCRLVHVAKTCHRGKECKTIITRLKKVCWEDKQTLNRKCMLVAKQEECYEKFGEKMCHEVQVERVCRQEGLKRKCRVVRLGKVCPGNKYYNRIKKQKDDDEKAKAKAAASSAAGALKTVSPGGEKAPSPTAAPAKPEPNPEAPEDDGCLVIPVKRVCRFKRKCEPENEKLGLCGAGYEKKKALARKMGSPEPKGVPVNITELLIPKQDNPNYTLECEFAPYTEYIYKTDCCSKKPSTPSSKPARKSTKKAAVRRAKTKDEEEEVIQDSSFEPLILPKVAAP